MHQDVEVIKTELAEIKQRIIKIERYLFWTAIITLVVIIVPLVGLLFAIPKFLGTYSDIQSLGL